MADQSSQEAKGGYLIIGVKCPTISAVGRGCKWKKAGICVTSGLHRGSYSEIRSLVIFASMPFIFYPILIQIKMK